MPTALALVPALPAIANDSTLNWGAHGPEPLDIRDGRESLIRMVEEDLIFHFGKWGTRVHVRFVFENTSADSTVRQFSGFPDMSVEPADWIGNAYLDARDISTSDQMSWNWSFRRRVG